MHSADDSVGMTEDLLSGSVKFGTDLKTTAELNLRTGPSTSCGVKLVMPKGATCTLTVCFRRRRAPRPASQTAPPLSWGTGATTPKSHLKPAVCG